MNDILIYITIVLVILIIIFQIRLSIFFAKKTPKSMDKISYKRELYINNILVNGEED